MQSDATSNHHILGSIRIMGSVFDHVSSIRAEEAGQASRDQFRPIRLLARYANGGQWKFSKGKSIGSKCEIFTRIFLSYCFESLSSGSRKDIFS